MEIILHNDDYFMREALKEAQKAFDKAMDAIDR